MSQRICLVLFACVATTLDLASSDFALAQAPDAKTFYVSPKGDDRWSGLRAEPAERDGPFATIARAQQAVRKFRATHPDAAVNVILRGGTYRVEETIEFTAADSGTKRSPVVYAAAKGEAVVLSGGRSLDPTAFTRVTDKAILDRLPEESREKVLRVDLKSQGVSDFGTMRPRGQGRPVTNPALELFINGQPAQLARWPNRGMVRRGEVLEKGGAPRYGDFAKHGGTFRFDFDRPERWKQAKDIWLSGYFARGYANDTIDVKSIDLEQRTITLARPHRYGLETVGPTQEYFGLNVLEEIDEPGEWYLDRDTGMLYLWPPSGLEKATVDVSLLEGPMVAMEDVSHVTLRGMSFETSRGMGVQIARGTGNRIVGCVFRNLGTYAVFFGQGILQEPDGLTGYRLQNGADRGVLEKYEPASRTIGDYGMARYADPIWNRQAGTDHGVVACDISNTGAGGVVLGGGDRKSLAAGDNHVLNTHIHHVGRLDGRMPAIDIDGVGNRVVNCRIHDAPLIGINFIGNDHVIERNELYNLCLPPAHDQGAVYTGRDPSSQGNVFRHNFLHHCGNANTSTFGIYLDDGACGVTIAGNVFYKVVGERTIHSWGSGHMIRNNLFVDSRADVHPSLDNTKWPAYMADPLHVMRMQKIIDIRQPPYITRYPHLKDLFETDPNYPRRCMVENNVSIRSGEFGLGAAHGKNNLVIDADAGFVDASAMKFQWKADSPIFRMVPGFEPIPFEKIGLQLDADRTTLPGGRD